MSDTDDTIEVPSTLSLHIPKSLRLKGDKGDKGDPGTNLIEFATRQYTPFLGSEGPYSGQEYTTQWGSYTILRDPINGLGRCWGEISLQLKAKGTFTGPLWVSLPWKVAHLPGVMGGQCTYISNPTPQSDWPTGTPGAPAPSWGWPILRFTGDVTRAWLDTNPLPGYNPPPLTGAFLNFHSQLSFNFHYPID